MKLAQEILQTAFHKGQTVSIQGNGSKRFLYSHAPTDLQVNSQEFIGIHDYQPTELFVRVGAGTRLAALENVLEQAQQMLPFEPPQFAPNATIGGVIACGLSGPAAPWLGLARDFVLGCRLLDGRGQILRFGGEVIKNVAGYDVSRLQCGAFGQLGLLTEISLKTLPRPETTVTLVQQLSAKQAIDYFQRLNRQPWPISAQSWHQGTARIRLWGNQAAVDDAVQKIGGDIEENSSYWADLREHRLAFFDSPLPLWRLSLPRDTPMLRLPGEWLLDWGGAQYWLLSDAPAAQIHALAQQAKGHAQPYHATASPPALPAAIQALQSRIKQVFDPKNLLNPYRQETR